MEINIPNDLHKIDEVYNSIVLADVDYMPDDDVDDMPDNEDEGEPSTPNHDDVVGDVETLEESPNGTVEFWIPNVLEEVKPILNSVWNKPEDAREMYEKYANIAGFVVRKGSVKYRTDRTPSNKYYLCNKQGGPKKVEVIDTISMDVPEKARTHRNTSFSVTGCNARIKLRNRKGTDYWELYGWEEKHNHPMVDETNKHLSKSNRQLLFEDEVFIQSVSTNNIGPTKAFRVRAAIKGGYDKVRGTEVDYCNSKRKINLFIGNRDAQMLVDKFKNRAVCVPDFTFDYKCEGNELTCIFWSDETSKCNYKEFGDVMAFDATYNTNKYKMVFVPFTGVDNHRRCVTFGAGLLAKEDIPSYSWLLRAFLKAHTNQPILVLTDQDPSLLQAVAQELPNSRHRLCMWHIMNKLPLKFDKDQLKNTDLRAKFHKLVWNVHLEPKVFEKRWKALIKEFELEEMNWLIAMFDKKEMWIPAYFKDLPLSCLMKTTSRSESSNAFFRLFTHNTHTLVQFMLCFETAMEKQRHAQRVLDDHTATTRPKMLTPLAIEVHAAKVYTRTMFFKIQMEIFKGCWRCTIEPFLSDAPSNVYMVKHSNKKEEDHMRFKVTINHDEDTIECRCNLFGRTGYLCRHIFCVLKAKCVERIPEKYITRRWRRDILPRHLLDSCHRYGYQNTEIDKQNNQAIANIELCLSKLRNDPTQHSVFLATLNKLVQDKIDELPELDPRKEREERYQTMLGVTIPAQLEIYPPTGINNKGSGTHTGKRLKNPREKFVNKKKKERRMRECKYCFVVQDDHDQRSCPIKLAKIAQEKAENQAAKEAAQKGKKARRGAKAARHS